MEFLTEKFIPGLINTGIILILLSPIPYGTVEVWSVSIFEITSIVIFCAWLIGEALTGRIELNSFQIYIPFGLFFLLIVMQIVPLPISLLNAISPNTADLWNSKLAELKHVFGDSVQMSYTISFTPYVTKQKLLLYVSYAMFYLVISNYISRRKQIKRLFWIVFSIAIIESSLGVLQFIIGLSHSSLTRASGTYINPNNYAGFLGMIVPLSLGFAISMSEEGIGLIRGFKRFTEVRYFKQFLILFATGFFALGLIFSESRGGIFSLAGSIVFFYFLLSWGKKARSISWSMIIFLVILVCYAAWIGLDPVIARYSETEAGLAGRVAVWKDTLQIIKHFPTVGTGLGSYALSFTLFKNQASLPLTYSHAHNDYLELAAETGLIGFILVLSGMILIFRKALVYVKTFPYRNDPLRYYLAIGSVSGIISMLIHAFTEFNFQIPANAYYLVFLLGLLTSIVYNQPRTHSY